VASIRIRDAGPSDADYIVECNLRLAEETEDKALDRDVLARGVARGLASPELCRYFVAEVDGRIAGTTMLTFELTDWRCGVIWWLQSVYIEPDMRRHGVFRAIYRHISGIARADADVRGLRLYVRHDNERARRTYEAMGMSHSGYDVFEDDWSAAGGKSP
jgi:GNAT superfamily N-acetyltransferase